MVEAHPEVAERLTHSFPELFSKILKFKISRHVSGRFDLELQFLAGQKNLVDFSTTAKEWVNAQFNNQKLFRKSQILLPTV